MCVCVCVCVCMCAENRLELAICSEMFGKQENVPSYKAELYKS